jgi:hypothetical protein
LTDDAPYTFCTITILTTEQSCFALFFIAVPYSANNAVIALLNKLETYQLLGFAWLVTQIKIMSGPKSFLSECRKSLIFTLYAVTIHLLYRFQ